MPIDETAIARLLEMSHVAHLAYRQAIRDGQKVAQREALIEARKARMQAQSDDPDHVAIAWASEEPVWPHMDLLKFYAEQLG